MVLGHNFGSETTKHDEYDDSHREDDTSAEAQDESGNLSDIDDEEVTNKFNILSVTASAFTATNDY